MSDTLCAHWLVVDCIRDKPNEWQLGEIPVVCYWCEETMTFSEWLDLSDAQTESGGD